MGKYIVHKPFASHEEGKILEFDRVPLAAQAHVRPYKGESTGKEFAVNPEELKAKAVAEYKESDEYKQLVANSEDESLEQLRRLHKEVTGKPAHGKSGAEKIADDILAALEPVEE